MTDETMTRRERWAAADAARSDARWGMTYAPDPRTATPERLAYEARERGDRWFQIDVPVSYTQGTVNAYDNYTRTHRAPEVDVIGSVEAQGWELAHVAATFVLRGEASMEHLGGAAATASHGEVVALYVFRRKG